MLLKRAEPGDHRVKWGSLELHSNPTTPGTRLRAAKGTGKTILPSDAIDKYHRCFAGIPWQHQGAAAYLRFIGAHPRKIGAPRLAACQRS